MDELPDPLTLAEIARLERVGISTATGWVATGKLKGYKVGGVWRVRRDDYLAFRKPNRRPEPQSRKPPDKVAGASRQRAADSVLNAAGI